MKFEDPGFQNFLEDECAPPVARRHICSFGGSSGTQTQTSQTSLPDWVNNAAQSNYQQAQQVSQNLMGPYTGQRVADLTPGQTSNIAAAQANVGSTNPAFQQAQNATSNFLNFNAPQVNPQQLAQTSLQPYMNPFTNQVVNSGLQALDVQRQQALASTGAQAAQSKAFGGSRQGVQEGIMNASAAMQAGQLASGLQSQNFLQAQQAAQGDITRNQAAQTSNQGAALNSAGVSLNAANQMGSLAGQQQQNFLGGLSFAQQMQGQQQAQTQAGLDAKQQLYTEQQQYPIQQLQILQNALTQSPYGKTTTTTGPGAADNTGMQAAGTGIAIAGTVAAFM